MQEDAGASGVCNQRGGRRDVVADNLCRDLGEARLRQKGLMMGVSWIRGVARKGLKIGFGRGWRWQSVSEVKG